MSAKNLVESLQDLGVVAKPMTDAASLTSRLRQQTWPLNEARSQYFEPYLDANTAAGPGKGITVSSFLAKELHGAAKKYQSKYVAALMSALKAAVAKGEVVVGTSVGGKDAYYYKDAAPAAESVGEERDVVGMFVDYMKFLDEDARDAAWDRLLESAPDDPVMRAQKRMNDAAKRGGLEEVVTATAKRIRATDDPNKIKGLVTALDQVIAQLSMLRRQAQSKA